MRSLSIGVVSETQMQQHYLKNIVEDSGYSAGKLLLVEQWAEELVEDFAHLDGVDAWVVDVDVERLEKKSWSDKFHQWLYNVEQPIIFSEGITCHAAEPNFVAWSRQLKSKLLHLEGQISLSEKTLVPASDIWVLAASTGGPEAVKRFLDAMDDDLDLAFIYVQHIEQNQNQVLNDTIARDSCYESFLPRHGDIVCRNNVMIVPVDNKIEIQPNGSVVVFKDEKWRGIYSPSVDQVVANVASIYGENAGVIFFSGMGDDGAAGCRLMSFHGGQVWAQALSDCVAPSMPQEAINTGYVEKIDMPESLAIHLKSFLKNKKNFCDKENITL